MYLRQTITSFSFCITGSYIQKLTPMFQIPLETEDSPVGGWSPQKVSNVHCMVQVIRALVAPSGSAQVITRKHIIQISCIATPFFSLSYYYQNPL